MRVAVIVTKSCRKYLDRYLLGMFKNLGVDVYELKTSKVAQLITTRDIAKEARHMINNLRNYDLIIIPGMVKGSTRVIEDVVGVKTIKGTSYIGDLPYIIKLMRDGKIMIRNENVESLLLRDRRLLAGLEDFRWKALNDYINRADYLFKVKNIKFCLKPPPLNLFYELYIDKRRVTYELIIDKLIKLGYQGVILGLSTHSLNSNFIKEVLRELSSDRLLIGIDIPTKAILRTPELLSYVDLIFNVDIDTLYKEKQLVKLVKDKIIVISLDPTLKYEDILSTALNIRYKLMSLGLDKALFDVVLSIGY